jgi:hypothetical protein
VSQQTGEIFLSGFFIFSSDTDIFARIASLFSSAPAQTPPTQNEHDSYETTLAPG